MYFHEYIQPLFPLTVPKLFQQYNSTTPVLGRVVLSPLYGANLKKYVKRIQETSGDLNKLSTKEKITLQTFLNSMYLNGAARKYPKKIAGKNFDEFAAHANKLACLYQLFQARPNDKALAIFVGGLRSFEAYIRERDTTYEIVTGSKAPLKKKERMGFLFKTSDAGLKNKQQHILEWYNKDSNIEGDEIRKLCVNASEYGTGVDFSGAVKEITLVNTPATIAEFLQWFGRVMRSCAYASLPKDEQKVRVNLMIATLDPRRTLEDLTDPDLFGALKRRHDIQPGEPILTLDEINFHNLIENYKKEMGRLQNLIANFAVDRPWLQSMSSNSKTVDKDNEDAQYVVRCDAQKCMHHNNKN